MWRMASHVRLVESTHKLDAIRWTHPSQSWLNSALLLRSLKKSNPEMTGTEVRRAMRSVPLWHK
jgi:hypothetical protein